MYILLSSVCILVAFSGSLPPNYKEPIKSVTLTNLLYKARPTLVSINSDEILVYQFTVSVNKCDRSCNAIDYLYPRVCVPNEVNS